MCETRSESTMSSKQIAQALQGAGAGAGCSSVMVPVSVRVPVLVLELTVVLGHKSDLLLERLDIAEAAKSSRQSSSTPISSRQYTLREVALRNISNIFSSRVRCTLCLATSTTASFL